MLTPLESRVPLWLAIAIGLAAIAATRIPLLTDPRLVLDGDEAIVGLMATDLVHGRRLPLYFDGQSYGLSLLETAVDAAAFSIAGATTESLKTATLILWAAGWIIFVLAVRRWADTSTAMLAGLLLLTMPAWGNYSVTAHGHYVGGFVTAQVLLLWLARLRASREPGFVEVMLAGVLCGILALTQVLWVVAMTPFVAAMLRSRERTARDGLAFLVPAGAIVLVNAVVLASTQRSFWAPEFLGEWNLVSAPARLAEALRVCLTGAYYYQARLNPGAFADWSSILWLIATGIAFLWLLVPTRSADASVRSTELLALGSIVAVLSATAMLAPDLLAYRHLMSIPSAFAIVVAAAMTRAWKQSRVIGLGATATLIALLVTGAGGILDVPRVWDARTRVGAASRGDLDALVRDLLARGIHGVYSVDGMLQWNLMFSSQEQLSARFFPPKDRRPELPPKVDQLLWNGQPVALVGTQSQLDGTRRRAASEGEALGRERLFGSSYFAIDQPSVKALVTIGFILHPKAAP